MHVWLCSSLFGMCGEGGLLFCRFSCALFMCLSFSSSPSPCCFHCEPAGYCVTFLFPALFHPSETYHAQAIRFCVCHCVFLSCILFTVSLLDIVSLFCLSFLLFFIQMKLYRGQAIWFCVWHCFFLPSWILCRTFFPPVRRTRETLSCSMDLVGVFDSCID